MDLPTAKPDPPNYTHMMAYLQTKEHVSLLNIIIW